MQSRDARSTEDTSRNGDIKRRPVFERTAWSNWIAFQILRAEKGGHHDSSDLDKILGDLLCASLYSVPSKQRENWARTAEECGWNEFQAVAWRMAGSAGQIFERLAEKQQLHPATYIDAHDIELSIVAWITYYIVAMQQSKYEKASLSKAMYLANIAMSRQSRTEKAKYFSKSKLDTTWRRFGAAYDLIYAVKIHRQRPARLLEDIRSPGGPARPLPEKILALALDTRASVADLKVSRGSNDLELILRGQSAVDMASFPLFPLTPRFNASVDAARRISPLPFLSQAELESLKKYSAGAKKKSNNS